MVQLTDTLIADEARICADGSLVVDARAARTGIQTYRRHEVDAPASFSGDTVRVWRPESEVFARDSMASFAAAPVTLDHPVQPVDSANWARLGKGEVNGDVVRDGEFVRVPLIVRDAATVAAARTSHKQLSAGYSCTLDWTPGTAPDGQAYDAVQRNIRINHIAAVPAARGGPELKISDHQPSQHGKDGIMPHTLTIDGLQVPNVSDEAKAAIEKLQGQVRDGATALQTATDKVSTLEGEKVALQTQLDEAKAASDPAKLDKLVSDRAALVALAKAAKPDLVTDGKTDAEIRKEVVTARLGDKAAALDEAGIAGAFVTITADAKPGESIIRNIPGGMIFADASSVRDLARRAQFN